MAHTGHVTRAHCPTCGGPLKAGDERARCRSGHEFDVEDLHVKASTGAVGALWSAVHALEDRASGARWRKQRPAPPAYLDETIEQADREADAIRDVLHSQPGEDAGTSAEA